MSHDLILAAQTLSCDQLVRAWLDAKTTRSHETHRAYIATIADFRQFLAPLDLDTADPRRIRAGVPPGMTGEDIADLSETLASAIALAAQT